MSGFPPACPLAGLRGNDREDHYQFLDSRFPFTLLPSVLFMNPFLTIQPGRFKHSSEFSSSGSLMLPKILLLDMNSFFASVEQQANPFLRGRPVGVCASMHPTSCLIAASKEAKQAGIKTGTLIRFARQICPDIVLVRSEPEKYRAVSREFNRIIKEYTHQAEPYSIDETFVDLRGTGLNPIQVGAELKQRIKDEAGEWLSCSVGIGDNKFLAKLAAELKKPDGLTIVWRDHLREVYKDLKLSDLWGIGRGWTRRLARLNITRPDQLLNYPVQNLISLFGKPGYYIWRRVNGLEEDSISPEENLPKSFGHSWVLNFRTTDKSRLQNVILRLAEKAARRMRREKFCAYGFFLSVRCVDGDGFNQHKKLKFAISTGSEFLRQALLMWKDWKLISNVNLIALGFTDLKYNYRQLSLFQDKEERLTIILDQINNKYGEFTIRSGMLTHSQGYAPDAIAFGK